MKKILLLLGLGILVLSNSGCRSIEVVTKRSATPTETSTPRPTFTPRPPTPTSTPIPRPTSTRTATRRPTVRPSATRTTAPLPTQIQPARSPYEFRVESIRCYHSGQSFVEGLVLENSNPHSGINGMLVRMSTQPGGPPAAPDYTTEEHGLNDARFQGSYNGYFWFGVNAFGHAEGQVRYVWVVNNTGEPLSDPNDPKARAQFNKLGPENPSACWNVQIIFRKIQ